MMPCPPEMQMCRRCGKELSYTKQAYAFEDKDHVCDGCKPIESKTTKHFICLGCESSLSGNDLTHEDAARHGWQIIGGCWYCRECSRRR